MVAYNKFRFNTFPLNFPYYSYRCFEPNELKLDRIMILTDAQELFSLFFAVYFTLIIDRSHETYKPWDTYSAWRGSSHNAKRLLAAWIILFIMPLLHFAILFTLLGLFSVQFDMTIRGISNVVLISLSSFFEFGYYRIYEAFMHRYPESFFPDEELVQMKRLGRIRPDFRAHFIPGALYILLSTLIMLMAIYY